MTELGKPVSLISDAERERLQPDSYRLDDIQSAEDYLQMVDAFIGIYLNEGFNDLILETAERNMGRAIGRISRIVNDPAFPIDKAGMIDRVEAIIEEMYSPQLEQANYKFVKEFIYNTLHHKIPALREQVVQQHTVLEPAHL